MEEKSLEDGRSKRERSEACSHKPSPLDPVFANLLVDSYRRLAGDALVPITVLATEIPAWLYGQAPFALLAHDTHQEPRFIYVNRTAQTLFEYPWDEFIGLASRLSAEVSSRDERQRLFDTVARSGWQHNYRGKRIAKSGRRFWIEDGVIWQLRDATGELRGEAAMVPRWTELAPGSDERI